MGYYFANSLDTEQVRGKGFYVMIKSKTQETMDLKYAFKNPSLHLTIMIF